MCRLPDDPPKSGTPRSSRAALSLVELLVASTIMTLLAGSLAGIGQAVQMARRHSEAHGAATQHARVCLERIARTTDQAAANEQFPGFAVIGEQLNGMSYPDTLVVWRGNPAPAQPDGLPRFNELVIFCPAAGAAHRLVEITVPSDVRQVPALTDAAAWSAALADIKQSSGRQEVVLTELLRSKSVLRAPGDPIAKGLARFVPRLRPSSGELQEFRASTRDWDEINWVQGIYGSQAGLAQNWVRFELQLAVNEGGSAQTPLVRAVPFFGSAAVYFELRP